MILYWYIIYLLYKYERFFDDKLWMIWLISIFLIFDIYFNISFITIIIYLVIQKKLDVIQRYQNINEIFFICNILEFKYKFKVDFTFHKCNISKYIKIFVNVFSKNYANL